MFCLKPKVTKVPEGEWFCPRCQPDDFKSKTRKRRQEFVEEMPSEEEEEEDDVTADDSTAGR